MTLATQLCVIYSTEIKIGLIKLIEGTESQKHECWVVKASIPDPDGFVNAPLQRLLSCDSILLRNKVASLKGLHNSSLYLRRTWQYDSLHHQPFKFSFSNKYSY